MTTYVVYRCYDRDGRLFYIGSTGDIVSRMAVHRSSRANPASTQLSLHMARYQVEEFPSESDARRAERLAIAAEAPLLNVHHNQGRGLQCVIEPRTGDPEICRKLDALFSGGAA